MTYGQVASHFTARLSAARLLAVLLFPLLALLPPTLAGRPAASEVSGTLLAVSGSSLSVQGRDGRAVSFSVTPATWFLKSGLPVTARDFVPGETVDIRTGRAGAALLVCDTDTAAALDAHRGQPLTGTILNCTPRVWIIQPSDYSPLPLPVCLTPRTAFLAAGAKVTAAAFGTGATVIVITRGLANGLLSAVSVSDADPAQSALEAAPKPHPAYFSGTVLEVRLESGLLTVQDTLGVSRTVAVTAGTRIKVRKQPAPLTGILPGMHVTGRIGGNSDAAGYPRATSLSVSDDAPLTSRSGKQHR